MRKCHLVALVAALAGATHAAGAVTPDQQNFCVRYAGHATSEATVMAGTPCGLTGPRWTTDHDQHLNWCLSNFAGVTDAAGEVRARALADVEDTARIHGIQDCQRAVAAGVYATPATVTADVDLYDQPGGTGNVIGMLDQGQQVALIGCRDDTWCETTKGWVWGEFLQR